MFEKGRAKTGGRTKNNVNVARRSNKFLERLKGHGFNYDAEMAQVLKDLKQLRTADRSSSDAIRRIEELKFYYVELKSLLPYMTPKLKEKEVIAADEPENPSEPSRASITDEQLIQAMSNGKSTETNSRTSDQDVLGARPPELQVSAGTNENLPDVVGEQEEDE